jgi:type 1 glutamine amidotransferase
MKQLTVLVVLLSVTDLWQSSFAADPGRILIVVGPSNHPPGTHEVAAGGRLMKHCLENIANMPSMKVDLTEEWPQAALRDSASTVVFIGDLFPANRMPNAAQNLADLDAMMRRGCGIVCVHYATGLLGEHVKSDGDHPLLHWMGGYFANRSCPHHESFAKIFQEATIQSAAPEHPVWRGCSEFTLNDEPYINNFFGKQDNKPAASVTVLATSMLPPEKPKPEAVSWCIERPDTGRGIAVVMPHFYRNWKNEDLRRYILNAIVWSAKLNVPDNGVQTELPDLSTFKPAALEPQPRVPRAKSTAAETKASSRFELSHWKLTLPIRAFGNGRGSPLEISAAQLSAGYIHADYFHFSPDEAMVFWCPVNGATTENTEYPRTELREVLDPADDNVCWAAPGTHVLSARCRVSEVPSSQKVIIGQIHGYSGKARPLIKLQFFNGRIESLVKENASKGGDLKLTFPEVGLDKEFDYEIKLQDGLLSATVNGTTQTVNVFEKDPEWARQSLYFKAGAYVQDNEGPASEGARVLFSKLSVSHSAE